MNECRRDGSAMKTKIEFSIQDYKMVHYDRPIMSLYAGIFFFVVTVFALVLGLIRGEYNDPEGFWPYIIISFLAAIICFFHSGLSELKTLGFALHKESLLDAKKKKGYIESIVQLNKSNGYRYEPYLMQSLQAPVRFKPGRMLTAASTMPFTPDAPWTPYREVMDRLIEYNGAYLTIDGERYLIISTYWFREGDYVWIRYLPNSKVVLEMDYEEMINT